MHAHTNHPSESSSMFEQQKMYIVQVPAVEVFFLFLVGGLGEVDSAAK